MFTANFAFANEGIEQMARKNDGASAKQIPFCTFNTVGYREQARAQLNAMEPERRRARKEGRPYEPRPIVFDFSNRRPR